jgi:hypothetical protein
MAELKKYTSFEALKLDEKRSSVNSARNSNLSEFEAFLKQLQNEFFNKKKAKTGNGKQPNR